MTDTPPGPRPLLLAALLAGACFSPGAVATSAESTGEPTTGAPASTSTEGTATTAAPTTSAAATGSTGAPATTGDATTTGDTTAATTGDATTGDATTGGAPCPNGVLDPGEQCDPGVDLPGDGCAADCTRDALFVFVSSTAYAASELGSLAGADAICDQLAATAAWPALPPSGYVAWLSDSKTSAASRLVDGDLPYYLPNGPMVAASSAAFKTAGLLVPVDHTEDGVPILGAGDGCSNADALVWTGTDANGESAEVTCNDWMATDDEVGLAGLLDATDELWTEACTPLCILEVSARIYCIEQPPP